MTFSIRLTFSLALALLLISTVWAKGVTVKIVVTSNEFSVPFSITDQDIVGQFSIWSGPNSQWRVKNGPWQTDYSRTFIDFPVGPVESPPSDLVEFDVKFFIAATPLDEPASKPYRIRYAINPSQPGGFFYLPPGNRYIHHSVEGNWFRSTDSWEKLVRPTIQSRL